MTLGSGRGTGPFFFFFFFHQTCQSQTSSQTALESQFSSSLLTPLGSVKLIIITEIHAVTQSGRVCAWINLALSSHQSRASRRERRLARSTTITRSPSRNDSLSVESVIEFVRKLWKLVEEQAEEPHRAKLKQDIARSINLLKGRIEKSLKTTAAPLQGRLLFSGLGEAESRPSIPIKHPPTKPRFTDPVPRIYDKDLVEHALNHLPEAIRFTDVESYRSYLTEKIRFNSQATRRRAAGYLIGRYFPGETLHRDIVEFAAKTAGKPARSDTLFYPTCRMEPIVAWVAEEVGLPLATRRWRCSKPS